LPLNKKITEQEIEEMKNSSPPKSLVEHLHNEPLGQWTKTSNQRKKAEQIDPNNPMLRLRHALKPTAEEVANRSPRDKRKKFLLQKELASRIPCCNTTIWQAEKEKRFPRQRIVYESSLKLYNQCFPEEVPKNHKKTPKAFMSSPSAKAHFKKQRQGK
jgi:hypothetical protein